MLRVDVSFPSGSGETLLLPEHSKVRDLKLLAQKTFGHGFLKLVTAEGHVLTNPVASLQAAGVQDGEHLTSMVQAAGVAATSQAFAAWCCGGNRIVTWGNPKSGGDCSRVQDRLVGVQEIQTTQHAFAAILADGPWLPGAVQTMAVTAQQFKTSSRMCSKFKPHFLHLRRSWQMDQW